MQPCLIPTLRGLKIRQIGEVNALSYLLERIGARAVTAVNTATKD